jgi:hypothetical protein
MSSAFWSDDWTARNYVNLNNLTLEERRIVEDALLAYTVVLPEQHVDQPALAALRTSLKETQ